MPRVLVSTIQPVAGGVPTMLGFVLDCLKQRACDVTIAYYLPYSVSPNCSVPLLRLPLSRPGIDATEYLGHRSVGVGCWLPELEFTHYQATRHWRELIDANDVHLVVSGSSLAALPFVQTQTPFLGWIASDWQGDRQHRVRQFPWYRRLLDSLVVQPMAKRRERQIIASNSLIALSGHTRTELDRLVSRAAVRDVLHMPIDTERFKPAPATGQHSDRYRIGFTGRFEDPRKHIDLLFTCVSQLVESIPELELVLVGDQLSTSSKRRVNSLGITDHVTVMSYIDNTDLPGVLQSLRLFVLPSYQEGLCISAVEAMSCGVPVVSTRCGGPESYINDGENGLLCAHQPESMTKAVLQLYSDEPARLHYAASARDTVIREFSTRSQTDRFLQLFDQLAPRN